MNRFAPVTTDKPRPVRGVLIAILVPLLTAGILIGVLHKPQEHLGQITAAIVNSDEPVELDGQLVPLGRQLAGGLVASGDADADLSGYRWEITDSTRATEGLEAGKYGAVVEIPPNFSAAATSTAGELAEIEQATISITTSPRARILDDAITTAIGIAATEMMGSELTETYLDNVFLGFNTLHDELGGAADGAGELAAGAGDLSDGVAQLHEGTAALDSGAKQLADGTRELAGGLGEMHDGIRELNAGSGALADGADDLSSGAGDLADGIAGLHDGLGDLADGASGLAGGLNDLAAGTATLPEQFAPLAAGIDGLHEGANQLGEGLAQQTQGLEQLQMLMQCPANLPAPTDPPNPEVELCRGLNDLAAGSAQLAEGAGGLSLGAQALNDGVEQIADTDGPLAELTGGIDALATGSQELADGLILARDGAKETATGAQGLAGGASELAAGATELNGGIRALEGGSSDIGVGAADLSTGTSELAEGITELDVGVGELAIGSAKLHDGTEQMADGLDEAVEEIPTYPDGQREEAARVIAAPVTLAEASATPFDMNLVRNWVGFFTVIALWISALWIYTGVPTTVRNYATTTRSSAWVSVRSLALPAAVSVGQALVVTVLVGLFGDISGGKLLAFAGVATLIALAFLLVQRALIAVLGRWGLMVSLGIAILAIATALTSAMPSLARTSTDWLPIGPAADSLNGIENGLGIAGPVTLLAVWALAGWIVVALSISRRRTSLR